MGSLELRQVSASHGDRDALSDIDLVVADAERLVLLGASGSGKTTVLRVIAGLHPVTAGSVRIDGRDVTAAPPRERGLSLMTQEGSLQPHLDVRGNLGFSLKLQRTPRATIAERVNAESRAFSLTDLLTRRPSTLAAGERHEVALARTLVKPGQQAMLIDEPFARLDAPRRAVLLRELLALQSGYGLTMVVATNDQRIAMGFAHRIAVLDGGRLLQLDTPGELHRRPADVMVAGAVGDPPMNLLDGQVQRIGGRVEVVADDLRLPTWHTDVTAIAGSPVTVGFRPTDVAVTEDTGSDVLHGVVRQRGFLGPSVGLQVDDGQRLIAAIVARPGAKVGDTVRLRVAPEAVHVFDATGRAIAHGV